jgi:putative ABC transport system ATP-binding protein
MELRKKVLEVKNIKKNFYVGENTIEVLKGVDFEIDSGEFVLILGPSGSGKSTLLHVLLGLEIPTDGDVFFLGQNVYSNTSEDDRTEFRKRHIGMVYQQPNWVKSIKVLQNVAFPLLLLNHSEDESLERAEKMLQLVGMEKWRDYYPTELSGGQQQRVALSRALVTEPDVIIADEPTGNLDYNSGMDLMNELAKLNKEEGRTIIMVTHDLEYIDYAKKAIQLLDGKVLNIFEGKDKKKIFETLKLKRGTNHIVA